MKSQYCLVLRYVTLRLTRGEYGGLKYHKVKQEVVCNYQDLSKI